MSRSIFYLPESPRWLLMKGRNAEAEKIVRDAAEVNGVTMAPFTLIGECQQTSDCYIGDVDELLCLMMYGVQAARRRGLTRSRMQTTGDHTTVATNCSYLW